MVDKFIEAGEIIVEGVPEGTVSLNAAKRVHKTLHAVGSYIHSKCREFENGMTDEQVEKILARMKKDKS
jgi:hypothetical protein